MNRIGIWSVAAVIILLAANIAILAKPVSERGFGKTIQDMAAVLSNFVPSGSQTNENLQRQFLCSEVERAEAGVWPRATTWAMGLNDRLPLLADARAAERILLTVAAQSEDEEFLSWVDQRLTILRPFAAEGFEPAGKGLANALSQIRDLNYRFDDFCEMRREVLSYKGAVVMEDPRIPQLIMLAEQSTFSASRTPECFVPIPQVPKDRPEKLLFEVNVSSEGESLTERVEVSLNVDGPSRERASELGFHGIVEEDGQLYAVFDFKEPASRVAPSSFSCQAAFSPSGLALVASSTVVVWGVE